MGYKLNLDEAARRHLEDADILYEKGRYVHAGYHYGFGAECALKAALQRLGHRAVATAEAEDPYFAHFPALKAAVVGLSGRLAGRLSVTISSTLKSGSFMAEWNVRMRYAGNNCVAKKRCDAWKSQAHEFIRACAKA